MVNKSGKNREIGEKSGKLDSIDTASAPEIDYSNKLYSSTLYTHLLC